MEFRNKLRNAVVKSFVAVGTSEQMFELFSYRPSIELVVISILGGETILLVLNTTEGRGPYNFIYTYSTFRIPA